MMKHRVSTRLAFFVSLVASLALGAAPATQPCVPKSFMRFVDADATHGASLQTADVEFRNSAGVDVHLVGAIHIGEKSYYDLLNREFQSYDAVLYEMVKPKDMDAPRPGDAEKSDNPVTEFQEFLKSTLDLDFQLDDIDYTASNFVHADLDRETFEKMEADRGESFDTIMLRMLMKAFTDPQSFYNDSNNANDDSDDDLVAILTRPDMERQIKLVLARQLGQMDLSSMGLDGPDGSVLVTERNKAALKVLGDSIAAGKKKIAIFYGAAHMTDMSKRLEEMGFSPVATRWNSAWDLTIRADQPSAMEKLLRGLLDSTQSTH